MKQFEPINKFEEELIGNGYNFFKDTFKNSIKGIQKRFTDENGTKYFITGYHYNFSKDFPERDFDDYDRYAFTVQFSYEGESKSKTVDISYSADFVENKWRPLTTLKEVEDYFENIWVITKAEYYERN